MQSQALQDEWDFYLNTFQQPGLGSRLCVKAYDSTEMARRYADSSKSLAYTGPRYVAHMVAAVTDKKDALILDIGAGTGLVGEELHKRGFTNIHAHDGAISMLETCKTKGVYSKFICCFLDEGLQITDVANDTYDAVAISGGTAENHFHPAVQKECVRIIKPGGYFVNAYRAAVLDTEYGQQWTQYSKHLEQEGKWDLYGRLFFPNYFHLADGFVDVYQVC